MDFRTTLKEKFGLDTVDYHYNLSKEELPHPRRWAG